MNNDEEVYKSDVNHLKAITELFINEIESTYQLAEEVYFILEENKGINSKDLEKFYRMVIVYLMSFLEIFNRQFFIKFFEIKPEIMRKKQKSPKDQEKLLISFDEILKHYIHGDPLNIIPAIMAEKIYNEIFSYDKMDFNIFIKKLLDEYLELEFTHESINRGLDFGGNLQQYRTIRNAIIHGTNKMSIKDGKFSAMELKNLIIEYIRILEELIYPKYFKISEKTKLSLDIDLDDLNYDED